MTMCSVVFISFVVRDNKVYVYTQRYFSITRRILAKCSLGLFFRPLCSPVFKFQREYDFGRCSALKLIYINKKPWFFIAQLSR